MNDRAKTNAKLLEEIDELRARAAELKAQVTEFERSRQTWDGVFQAVDHSVLILDPDHNIVAANHATVEATGRSESELLGMRCYEAFHGTGAPPASCPLNQTDGAGLTGRAEGEVEAFGGLFLVSCTPVRDAAGQVESIVHMAVDITEARKTEKALRESESLHRGAIEALGGVVYNMEGGGDTYPFMSQGIREMTGYGPEELTPALFKSLALERRDLLPSESGPTFVGRGVEAGEPEMRQAEILIRTRDGRERWLLDSAANTYRGADEAAAWIGILLDITQHKQMERELIRLERLRALGEMSAGVSHNLNNILTSALGPAQLIKRLTADPAVLREAEDIIGATTRARDLVHRLHLATRGVSDEGLQAVQVGAVVEEAVKLSRPRWKYQPEARGITVEVVSRLEDTPAVRASESGLHDIVVNLILNAVDAMPEGGRIDIRAAESGKGARITLSDTGIGMDEETRRRVFEPFFTTKLDVGSGLGLSTAYAAVTRWGGEMSVESTPGEGTLFSIWLPAWTGPEAEAGSAEDTGAGRVRSAEILIVEDDRGVCDFLSRLLGGDHEVKVVADGQEAMQEFAAGQCDVALIDLGIPGMPGDRVAREMRAADPALVTVLITGWELAEDDPRALAFDFRIQKPFDDLGEVERVVAEAVALQAERASS